MKKCQEGDFVRLIIPQFSMRLSFFVATVFLFLESEPLERPNCTFEFTPVAQIDLILEKFWRYPKNYKSVFASGSCCRVFLSTLVSGLLEKVIGAWYLANVIHGANKNLVLDPDSPGHLNKSGIHYANDTSLV